MAWYYCVSVFFCNGNLEVGIQEALNLLVSLICCQIPHYLISVSLGTGMVY